MEERQRELGIERREWLESIDYVLQQGDAERVRRLLNEVVQRIHSAGIEVPHCTNTPYINTIPVHRQPEYPGDREIERRIKSIVRWNAMAMVVRGNTGQREVGGHISTFASVATLYEVGLNHFFRAPSEEKDGDHVYFQGHASPGNYARAYLEGRITQEELQNFRCECRSAPGLPSYPHPWLKPDFWEFATVSMGLGPIMAIYQARFERYLQDRGLKDTSKHKVWAFVGDGETDEPETLGSISLAGRERLDNLVFVVNCNLQRLDGPVRGNGNIIQELETFFRGAGWNVIKVVWGAEMDPLLEKDHSGALQRTLGELVDGEHQNLVVKGGAYVREHLFGRDAELRTMVEELSDEELGRIGLGGHDPEKVYTAYQAAMEHEGAPTAILARTVKGYGLGEAGEGRNVTHQQKKLNEAELLDFRTRFDIPISDEEVGEVPFYRPDDDSDEMRYLHQRRQELGGYVPSRMVRAKPLKMPDESVFAEFRSGSGKREVATTMAFVRLLSGLMQDDNIGKHVVPIVPDEARTFGMDALFRQVGIYSHVGQLYDPVDSQNLLYYREAQDGQILEEGITEAGSMSSFIAAGTSYASHAVYTIPFFIFYSMFGFQRVGDLIWAAGDMQARGFLLGGTAGRTTLAGEGLQHCDGNSHLLAYPHPSVRAYDPAFAYEIATIVEDGIRRMVVDEENVIYYLTLFNETYPQLPMPDGVASGILEGIYRLSAADEDQEGPRVGLLSSGALVNCALRAQAMLQDDYGVAADVYSVTSYKELYRDGVQNDRWNSLHPGEEPRTPCITRALDGPARVFVASTDYVRALPQSVAAWVPGRFVTLGTDGFGRSDDRAHLRSYFEVDERAMVVAALTGLVRDDELTPDVATKAMDRLDIDPDREAPILG